MYSNLMIQIRSFHSFLISNSMKKTLISIKYDGLKNTINNISTRLKKLTYAVRRTVYLSKEIKNHLDASTSRNNFEILFIDKPVDLIRTNSKLELLPCKTWFKNNSKCCLTIKDNKVVAYAWLHLERYNFDGENIVLDSDTAWLGPVFVNKDLRRQGINNFQIEYLISEAAKIGKTKIETSANNQNTASIRTFTNLGFSFRAIIDQKFIFGKKKKVERIL